MKTLTLSLSTSSPLYSSLYSTAHHLAPLISMSRNFLGSPFVLQKPIFKPFKNSAFTMSACVHSSRTEAPPQKSNEEIDGHLFDSYVKFYRPNYPDLVPCVPVPKKSSRTLHTQTQTVLDENGENPDEKVYDLWLQMKDEARFKTKHSTLDLPPGPRKIPFIGNMHLLAGPLPHRALRGLAMKYGPLMHLQLGEVSTVVVSSADIAKEVMKTQDTIFASRPEILAAKVMSCDCPGIVFSPYGSYWRQLRKICTTELLSSKSVQSFRSLREEEFLDLCGWIASRAGTQINLTEKVYSSAYSFTAKAAFGKKTKGQETFISIIRVATKLAAGFEISDVYPSVKLLPLISGMKSKLESLQQQADPILETIIDEHIVGSVGKIDVKEKHDLVDVLLKFQEDENALPLTSAQIKSVLLDIFSAGSETSATTIDWAMSEMLRNPSVLKKAQDEVRNVFEGKGFVDEAQFNELKYLKSVIKETLRLHPPAPLLLPRESNESCKIDGFDIPIKTRVIVNAWAIGRDPKYWKEPECFQPERFLDSSVDYKGNSFEYIPFGAGRRICPGMSFGIANVELPLAMFLYHFDWGLPDGMKHEEMDMREAFGVTVRRKDDLFVTPVVRRPLPV